MERLKKLISNLSASPNAQKELQPFHLAFPVHSLDSAREFYGEILSLPEGRSASRWIDYNLYGNQIVCQLVDGYEPVDNFSNQVDSDAVPVPHFGIALTVDDFHDLSSRVRKAGIKFIIEPHRRFQGQPGDQWTIGNSLEFKAMVHPENLFAKYYVDE
eukprot:snap_masked-scaffold_18-processed-gene-5.17-mRNA-1 protein AED:0.20 eAED:0.20 QI:0/0/0/1/1/1/2/0/157